MITAARQGTVGKSHRTAAGSETAFASIATVLYGIALALLMSRHEMWRDEVQAWEIVRASPTLPALFHNLRYEGHPALWHLILWPLARLTPNPAAMQAPHFLIACAGAYLVLRWCPLSRLERIGCAFGYCGLFEYGVISRNYGVGIVLLLLACHTAGGRRPLRQTAALLALAMQTNLYAAILAVALGIVLIARSILRPTVPVGAKLALPSEPSSDTQPASSSPAAGPLRSNEVSPGLPAAILIVGFALLVLQVRPPADSGVPRHGLGHVDFAAALAQVAYGLLPIPVPVVAFWNTSLLHALAGSNGPGALLGLVLVIAVAFTLRRSRLAIGFFLAAAALLTAFELIHPAGNMRHVGHYFVAWLMAAWLAGTDLPVSSESDTDPDTAPLVRKAVTAVLVAAQIAAAIVAGLGEWRYPFSDAPVAAAYIETHHMEGLPAFGTIDYAVASVDAHLPGPIYYPNAARSGTYVIWNRSRLGLTEGVYWDRLRAFSHAHPAGCLVIVNPAVHPHSLPPGFEHLADFDRPCICGDETYTLYRVDWNRWQGRGTIPGILPAANAWTR